MRLFTITGPVKNPNKQNIALEQSRAFCALCHDTGELLDIVVHAVGGDIGKGVEAPPPTDGGGWHSSRAPRHRPLRCKEQSDDQWSPLRNMRASWHHFAFRISHVLRVAQHSTLAQIYFGKIMQITKHEKIPVLRLQNRDFLGII